jgi:hypothetical protein
MLALNLMRSAALALVLVAIASIAPAQTAKGPSIDNFGRINEKLLSRIAA